MNFSFEKKIAIAFSIIFVAIIFFLVEFYKISEKIKSSYDLINRSQNVLNENNKVLLFVINFENNERRFVITGDSTIPALIQDYKIAIEEGSNMVRIGRALFTQN